MEREQGDINTTPSREKWWKRNMSERGRKILDDDNRYFLRQSLSTPVMNAIGDVAGMGLHIGIDLVTDPKTKTRAVDAAESVMYKCMEKGLAFRTRGGNVITLLPALVITRDEMDHALDILDEALYEEERGESYS